MTKFRDEKVVIFLNYELGGSTIIRCAHCSTDRRDCCIGDSGAITFKFWGTIKVKVHVNTFERTCLEHLVRVKRAGAWTPDSKITDLSVTALKWL